MFFSKFLPVLLFVVVVWNIETTQGCSCFFENIYGPFCRADFVALGLIKDVDVTADHQLYTLRPLFYFRRTAKFLQIGDQMDHKLEVATALNSAACGVRLGDLGEIVLVSGHVSIDDKLRTGLCNWNTKLSALKIKTREQLFSGGFAKMCDTKVKKM